MGTSDQGKSLSDVEDYNKKKRQRFGHRKGIVDIPDIGDLSD